MCLVYEKFNTLKKRKKTKSKIHWNQEDLHKCVRSMEINLQDFLKMLIQTPHIRSFINSKQ